MRENEKEIWSEIEIEKDTERERDKTKRGNMIMRQRETD